ncbi:MAG: S26 family signal peptidase [Acholeplasmataceae bacterium]
MKKIISITLSVIAGLLIIGVIGIMISATLSIKNNEPAYIFGYALGVVPTDSMIGDNEDSLDVNDMYIMKKATIEDVDIDDVIVYQGYTSSNEEILIVHRIVGESSEGFITQGDNEDSTDQDGIQDYITSDNLVGKYVEKITFLKPISLLVQSNRSYVFLALVVVIFILLITEIFDLAKTYQKEKIKVLDEKQALELEAMKVSLKKEIEEEIKKEKEIK